MSHRLWKAYYENDLDTIRHLLESTSNTHHTYHRTHSRPTLTTPHHNPTHHSSSPGSSHNNYGTPPKRRSAPTHTPSSTSSNNAPLTKSDLNAKDAQGRTLVHHACSSSDPTTKEIALLLIQHPWTDLYPQDAENGWTALHRALYVGNVGLGRVMLERDATSNNGGEKSLIKVKDREGLGPLDLFAATIRDRSLRPGIVRRVGEGDEEDDGEGAVEGDGWGEDGMGMRRRRRVLGGMVEGDQLFTFGSNQNVTLGFGDQDDRQFPERINLRKPEHLIKRFYREQLEAVDKKWSSHDATHESRVADVQGLWMDDIPFIVRASPLMVQDVHMSKLHTAVLTGDPESNLYICGHGQSGRLGTGDERTRFHFVCVEGGALSGKKVAAVALGQNHTLAVSDEGEIFSWGSNAFGQLGYSLPKVAKDEEPISTIPRQIYGILKREAVAGIAASRIHSAAFTATSLYTFGKNEGQLGITDSEARSVETQCIPRKIAASFTSPVKAVTAIDKATVCLLDNHDVWVFANYGYAKVQFPLDGFTNYFLRQSFMVTSYDHEPNRIAKIISEGDTICALSTRGEIYTLAVSNRLDSQASTSTTNPSKIRSAITHPQRIWSPKKSNMAARDFGVDVDGSIILTTEEGSVWRRTARTKIADPLSTSLDTTKAKEPSSKSKDYKFSRIPGLTRVLAVRASGHGAYAAIRRDCDVLKTQLVVEDQTLWKDLFPLLSLRHMLDEISIDEEDQQPRFWQGPPRPNETDALSKVILKSATIESDVIKACEKALRPGAGVEYDAFLASTSAPEVRIPVHRFVLAARSRVLRRGFRDLCETSTFTIPDVAVLDLDQDGRLVVKFLGLDLLTIIDLALYLYTDTVVDFWHYTKRQEMAFSYRQVRTELMRIAAKLEMVKLEPAVRQMVKPRPCLDMDLELSVADPSFFYDANVIIQLEDEEVRAHSVMLVTRCPFFEGMFKGRAEGRWLTGREQASKEIRVDLSHIDARIFNLVLRFIYSDCGTELFDDILSADLDEFLDLVLDVMGAANELMLDRLSQIAQSIIGRFVNVRNVCSLLNAIAPSSVREFHDAALEYLCLNLEALLQGHHLSELDKELSEALDEIVSVNQLACMPFARSGRAELELHERHPELAGIIDRNRQARIDSVTIRSKFHNAGAFAPGSVGDEQTTSPIAQKSRRRSSNMIKNDVDRPALKAKASSKDMMFDMDEDPDFDPSSPRESPSIRPMTSPRALEPIMQSTPPEERWFDSRGKVLPSPKLAPQSTTPSATTPRTPRSPPFSGKTPPAQGKPWTFTPLPPARTDMREIMAQTASGRVSSLSQGLASTFDPLPTASAAFNTTTPKMSQKDRKRMQHASPSPAASGSATPTTAAENSPFSWHAISAQKQSTNSIPKLDLPSDTRSTPSRTVSTPQLTMRQTVSNPRPASGAKHTIGPAGQGSLQPPQQQRSVSHGKPPASPTPAEQRTLLTRQQSEIAHFAHSKPIPQSIRHQPPPIEQNLSGLSISEIVAQQLAEKDLIKEAAAKRDLQEIQAEQEFQEWWDKESKRVQEEEKREAAGSSGAGRAKRHHRGRGKGGPKQGGKGAGPANAAADGGNSATGRVQGQNTASTK